MKSKMKKKTEYSNLVVVWVFGIERERNNTHTLGIKDL